MSPVYGILKAANAADGREKDDFYPTPVEATIALLRTGLFCWPWAIWEPACGEGHIGKTLEHFGRTVIATDLVDRGYGQGGIDFLQTTRRSADAIITNPPFGKLARSFIEHALNLETPYIAMLLNVNYWHAANRTALWEQRRPEAIYALCWRLDFTGSERSYFNCIWTVWGPVSARVTRYDRIRHPFK